MHIVRQSKNNELGRWVSSLRLELAPLVQRFARISPVSSAAALRCSPCRWSQRFVGKLDSSTATIGRVPFSLSKEQRFLSIFNSLLFINIAAVKAFGMHNVIVCLTCSWAAYRSAALSEPNSPSRSQDELFGSAGLRGRERDPRSLVSCSETSFTCKFGW